MAGNIDLNSIRTTEDIINVLSVLYFNLNEIERIYYDMFINTTPMDVTFQRYSDTGVLETVTVPNRAKDIQSILSGSGAPNGAVEARAGVLYLDATTYDLYYKSSGADSQGWVKVWTGLNLVEGVNFISPTGNASQLVNLNMNNAGSGVLAVGRGGTGTTSILGMVKGNGDSAMTSAVDGEDYLGPESMVGIIAYYPNNNIPFGWLRCDGAAYSQITYARLYDRIQTTYGSDGANTFRVPNLFNYFVRCWDGTSAFNTEQGDQVGTHRHELSGSVGSESSHTHGKGDMNITGRFPVMQTTNWFAGAFSCDTSVRTLNNDNSNGSADYQAVFNAATSWTGSTSGGTAHTHSLSGLYTKYNLGGASDIRENRVKNKMLVPVIKF